MRDKISRIMAMAIVAAAIIIIWFISNIVRWQMGIPYRQSDWPMVIWSRFCAVMWAVAILCELRWPIAIPLNDGQFMKRVFLLAALGGLLASPIALSGFPHITLLGVVLAPILLAVFGGVQMSIAGTIMTASMFPRSSSPKQ